MGYFRILYYITYSLNFIMKFFKRNKKFLFWLVCIFLFLVVCMYGNPVHAAYEGNTTYTDPNKLLFDNYHFICVDFLRRYDVADNISSTDYKTEIKNLMKDKNYNYYIYYGAGRTNYGQSIQGLDMMNQVSYQNRSCYIAFIDNSVSNFTRTITTDDYFELSPVSVSKFTYNDTSKVRVYRIASNQISLIDLSNTNVFEIYMPSVFWFYNDDYIFDYFYNNYSLQEIELLYEMNSKLDSIDNKITEEPNTEDFTSSDLPSDSGVTDPTTDGLNGIFQTVYTTFTGNIRLSDYFSLPIPFTNKSIPVDPFLTQNAVNSFNNTILKNIISAFWYYLVARYILIDIINKFEKIQSGDIENLENDNIKEDML